MVKALGGRESYAAGKHTLFIFQPPCTIHACTAVKYLRWLFPHSRVVYIFTHHSSTRNKRRDALSTAGAPRYAYQLSGMAMVWGCGALSAAGIFSKYLVCFQTHPKKEQNPPILALLLLLLPSRVWVSKGNKVQHYEYSGHLVGWISTAEPPFSSSSASLWIGQRKC